MTRPILTELLAELCAAGILEDAAPAGPELLAQSWANGLAGAFTGRARVEGRELRVRIGIPRRFPNVLPRIYVLDLDSRLPHVHKHGYVCYSEHDGVLLDRRDAVAVVADALRMALELVASGLRGDNSAAFIEELALYWPGQALALSMVSPGEEIRWVCGVRMSQWWHLFDNRAQANRVLPGLPAEQVLYVPLHEVTRPIDSTPSEWGTTEITRFIKQNLTDAQRKSLHMQLRGKPRTSSFVVVRVPLPRGGQCLIGVEYLGIEGEHPLTRRPGTAGAQAITVFRQDLDYLVARGGGLAAVRRSRALLIGCGAVGGHVAGELARAGVQALTLVDPDELRPENAYRHVLGQPLASDVLRAFLKSPAKVHLLNFELKTHYPALTVEPVAAAIEQAIEAGTIRLADFDIVVAATGDPNVDRWLNEIALDAAEAPPIVYTWLEPLGLGGHAALIAGHGPKQPRPAGCLDCLFTPAQEERAPALCNRAAFAAPGQAVTRELAACGNAFTPFGSLDATRTAELAVRLALQAMTGEHRGALLRSWKGDPAAFRTAGYRTSPRFEEPVERLEHAGEVFSQPHCPVCAPPFMSRRAAAPG
ncbi:ThiF family adenylyltransferase [Nannocystis bainbridge]|uniref:ThiF family adenylyltransferase n=1 Tax=Nannocystis bainbridge TaxID=2995303 RepID=A0ABT5DV96_9BACT|nr:ThiF family adenylyltransferase [Nannocystis bainbridge]MDC0717501.1 ThiF family adenylyltransferase [Nannocystis bainbridge]